MSLAEDIATLQAVPLFRSLDMEALRLIAFAAEARRAEPGEVLFRKGDASDGGYVLMSGCVSLDGDPSGPLFADQGALIGELALLIESKRPATAKVVEPALLLKISRGVFRRVLEEYPAAAQAIQAMIERRLHSTMRQLDVVGERFAAPRD